MNVLIVDNSVVPAIKYGGTERVIWSLGKALSEKGHKVTFLAKEGSSCSFGKVLVLNSELPVSKQIPEGIDVVHLNYQPNVTLDVPYVITQHGNGGSLEYEFDKNTIFVSKNHANRYGSDVYVHNGLDWSMYAKPDLAKHRSHYHFLAKAAWRLKNVKGAINITDAARQKIIVLGGNRLNLKMGFRFTTSFRARFRGLVDNQQKSVVLNGSKGLIFPVLWHEPFGLALIESLYYGCPVYGTPYGSLPELITPEYGFLSADSGELTKALQSDLGLSAQRCHEYARECFNESVLAEAYLSKYEEVLNGRSLNAKAPKLMEQQQTRFLPFS